MPLNPTKQQESDSDQPDVDSKQRKDDPFASGGKRLRVVNSINMDEIADNGQTGTWQLIAELNPLDGVVEELRFCVSDEDLEAYLADEEKLKDTVQFHKFYRDSFDHEDPEAERTYRQARKQMIVKSLEIIMGGEGLSEILYDLRLLQESVSEERATVRRNANVGSQIAVYRAGYQVEAARTRGSSHGLIDAIRLAESCFVKSADWESVEAEEAIELANIRRHLRTFAACVQSVCLWADGDCNTVELHDFYFESLSPMPEKANGLFRVPGFVGEFVEYCNEVAYRRQPELAMATGITTLATLCGRKVQFGKTRCNIFFIGLAGTGSGKEDPRRVAKELLWRCGKSASVSESFASAPGLILAVHEAPDHLALLDEFGRYLASQNSRNAESYKQEIPTVMMRMYSSSNTYFLGGKKADAKTNPTPEIHNPNLNVMATTVPGNFFRALQTENVGDGFLNRLLVFQPAVDLPEMQDGPEIPIPDSLIEEARRWAEFVPMGGDGNLSYPIEIPVDDDAQGLFNKFRKLCDDIAKSERTILSRGLWVRTYEKARKLAMLYACSESFENPHITAGAASWAIAFATHCTEFVEEAAGVHVADNEHQRWVKTILKYIKDAGIDGMAQSQLYDKVDHKLKGRELREILTELVEAGKISMKQISTGGRPAHRYFAE